MAEFKIRREDVLAAKRAGIYDRKERRRIFEDTSEALRHELSPVVVARFLAKIDGETSLGKDRSLFPLGDVLNKMEKQLANGESVLGRGDVLVLRHAMRLIEEGFQRGKFVDFFGQDAALLGFFVNRIGKIKRFSEETSSIELSREKMRHLITEVDIFAEHVLDLHAIDKQIAHQAESLRDVEATLAPYEKREQDMQELNNSINAMEEEVLKLFRIGACEELFQRLALDLESIMGELEMLYHDPVVANVLRPFLQLFRAQSKNTSLAAILLAGSTTTIIEAALGERASPQTIVRVQGELKAISHDVRRYALAHHMGETKEVAIEMHRLLDGANLLEAFAENKLSFTEKVKRLLREIPTLKSDLEEAATEFNYSGPSATMEGLRKKRNILREEVTAFQQMKEDLPRIQEVYRRSRAEVLFSLSNRASRGKDIFLLKDYFVATDRSHRTDEVHGHSFFLPPAVIETAERYGSYPFLLSQESRMEGGLGGTRSEIHYDTVTLPFMLFLVEYQKSKKVPVRQSLVTQGSSLGTRSAHASSAHVFNSF